MKAAFGALVGLLGLAAALIVVRVWTRWQRLPPDSARLEPAPRAEWALFAGQVVGVLAALSLFLRRDETLGFDELGVYCALIGVGAAASIARWSRYRR